MRCGAARAERSLMMCLSPRLLVSCSWGSSMGPIHGQSSSRHGQARGACCVSKEGTKWWLGLGERLSHGICAKVCRIGRPTGGEMIATDLPDGNCRFRFPFQTI